MVDTLRYVWTGAPGGGDGSELNPYNSLESWRNNEVTNIAAGNRHLCYFHTEGAAPDPTHLDLNGFTGEGELHLLRWPGHSEALIRPHAGADGHAIETPDTPTLLTVLHDLQINMGLMVNLSEEGIRINRNVEVRRCKVYNGTVVAMDGIYFTYLNPHAATITISDCQVFNIRRFGIVNQRSQNKNANITNCIVWDIWAEIDNYCGIGYDGDLTRDNSMMRILGCAAEVRAASPGQAYGRDTNIQGFTADSDFNIANDDSHMAFSSPNSIGYVTFQEGTGGTGDRAMFENLTGTQDEIDLRIIDHPDNKMRGFSIGPSYPGLGQYISPTDFFGTTRGLIVADCGMHEWVETGGEVLADMQLDLTHAYQMDVAVDLGADMTLAQQAGLGFSANFEFDTNATLAQQAGLVFAAAFELGADVSLANVSGLSGDALADFLADMTLAQQAGLAGDAFSELDRDIQLDGQLGIVVDEDTDIGATMTYGWSSGLSVDEDTELGALMSFGMVGAQAFEPQIEINRDTQLAVEASLQADSFIEILRDTTLATVQSFLTQLGLEFSDDITLSFAHGLTMEEDTDVAATMSFGSIAAVSADSVVEYLADIGLGTINDLVTSALAELLADVSLPIEHDIQMLASLELDEDIVLGVIVELSADATVATDLTFITPGGRTLQLTQQDRIARITKQNRIMRIWKDEL